MKTIAMLVALVAVAAAQGAEPRAESEERRADISVKPLVAVRGGGWEAGVRFAWAWGPGRGGEHRTSNIEHRTPNADGTPTHDAAGRTAYVEQAVPLWRQAPGELVAAASAGVADINAAVVARDEAPKIPVEWPWWRRAVAHTGRHFEYRRAEYTAGGAVGLVATIIGIAVDQSRDDGAPAAQPAAKDAALVVTGAGNVVNLTDETGGAGGQIYVEGQNNTVTVTRKPPEEE